MWSIWLVFCDCCFHSVCPLMDKDKGLGKLPDGRDWLWGNLGLVLMCGAMFSKSLIQFSVDGQGSMFPTCFKTVVLEKTLESPLDCKEIKPVYPKGNQPWIFIGRTDAEAEAPILGPLMWRASALEKTLMLGKIEDKRRRGRQRMRWLDGIFNSMDMSLS